MSSSLMFATNILSLLLFSSLLISSLLLAYLPLESIPLPMVCLLSFSFLVFDILPYHIALFHCFSIVYSPVPWLQLSSSVRWPSLHLSFRTFCYLVVSCLLPSSRLFSSCILCGFRVSALGISLHRFLSFLSLLSFHFIFSYLSYPFLFSRFCSSPVVSFLLGSFRFVLSGFLSARIILSLSLILFVFLPSSNFVSPHFIS